MSEFKGKAGRIYVEKADNVDDHKWEVWFEDFCILGTGNTEIDALVDAKGHTADIIGLISQGITETLTPVTAKDDHYEEQAAGAGGDRWLALST